MPLRVKDQGACASGANIYAKNVHDYLFLKNLFLAAENAELKE
jgi:hypothetical protein